MDAKLYMSPYMRVSSAFIGYLTWYHVTTESQVVRTLQWHGIRTLLVAVIVIFGLFGLLLTIPEIIPVPSMWITAKHESSYRVFFTVAIAAITVVVGGNNSNSTNNYGKGVISMVKWLLKNRVTKQIAKLSYAIYPVHPFFKSVATEYRPRITVEQFEMWRFVPSGATLYEVAVIVAVPCYLIKGRVNGLQKSGAQPGWKTKEVQKTRWAQRDQQKDGRDLAEIVAC